MRGGYNEEWFCFAEFCKFGILREVGDWLGSIFVWYKVYSGLGWVVLRISGEKDGYICSYNIRSIIIYNNVWKGGVDAWWNRSNLRGIDFLEEIVNEIGNLRNVLEKLRF